MHPQASMQMFYRMHSSIKMGVNEHSLSNVHLVLSSQPSKEKSSYWLNLICLTHPEGFD